MPFTAGSTPFGYFDNDPQFQSDADKIAEYTYRKLGEPVMNVHLSSSHIYAAFEEACLEFSAITNSYQAKSVLSQFLGAATGSLSGSENKYTARTLEFQKKMAEPFGEEAGVNGSHPVYSASIDLQGGTQKYDLQAMLTGTVGNGRMEVRQVFHYSPLQAYRFFGTTSAVNYLNSEFHFESFTPETVFYLLPIWEDILRGMQFETSNRVRRSNYSYELHNNVLTLYPTPSSDMKLWFTYTLPPDPTAPTGPTDSSHNGVSNLSNIPFGNIEYAKINSIGKQWIRRMSFALSKEVEGQIRSKMSSIPTPNGELTLNGAELISDARNEQEQLRGELREILEETTYDKLAAREAEMAEQVQRTIKEVPLGIYIG
jgi:hypothetical protein